MIYHASKERHPANFNKMVSAKRIAKIKLTQRRFGRSGNSGCNLSPAGPGASAAKSFAIPSIPNKGKIAMAKDDNTHSPIQCLNYAK